MNAAEMRRDAGECERIAAQSWGDYGRLLAGADRARETAERAERMSLALSRRATAVEAFGRAWEAGVDAETDPEAFEASWAVLEGHGDHGDA